MKKYINQSSTLTEAFGGFEDFENSSYKNSFKKTFRIHSFEKRKQVKNKSKWPGKYSRNDDGFDSD